MSKNVFAGVGISKNDDSYEAGKEASRMAMEDMKKQGGKEPIFGFVFCSGGKYGKNESTLKNLVDGAGSVFGNTPWVGCTTCGEISNWGATTNSCVVAAISSDYLQFSIGIGDNVHKNPVKAGEHAISQAIENLRRETVINPYLKYTAEKKKTS